MTLADRMVLMLVRLWVLRTHRRLLRWTRQRTNRRPDPVTPESIEDKFLWRKLFDHNPLFTIACDKIAAKAYVQSACPGLRTARVLWSGKNPTWIPADLLCGDVIVKANHGSGFNLPVQGGKYDVDVLVDKARRWMRVDFGRIHGEWGYRNVDRRIFVEEMLFDEGVPVRTEYKFHVCGGRTAYIVVKLETEEGGTEFLVLDRDGRAFSVPDTGVGEPVHFELPTNFSRMRTVAERLGGEFDFIRVDLYDLGDSVYFSELTVYPGSGRGHVGNADLMRRRNDLWDLRSSWFLGVPHSGWRQRYACALRRLLDSRLPTTDGNSKAPFPRVRGERS